MNALQAMLLAAVPAIVLLPGVMAAGFIFRKRSIVEALFLGPILALVSLLYVTRFSLKSFPIVLALMYAGGIMLLLMSRARRIERPRAERSDWIAALVSLSAYLMWWIASMTGILPSGRDAMSNVLLSAMILDKGSIPVNWLPFESIPLNMAAGGSLWVAILSWLTGASPHLAFKAAYLPFAFLTPGLIYLIGKEIFGNRPGAIISALLWTAAANWGGIDFLRWGGLPNMMGMAILLAAIWVIAVETGFKRWALVGFLFAGTILVEHYAALTMAAVFIAIIAADLVAEGKLSERSRDILFGCLFTLLLLPHTIFRIFAGLSHSQTQTSLTFSFPEYFVPINSMLDAVGFEVAVGGSIGLVFAIIAMKEKKDVIAPAWLAGTIALLAFTGYLWRTVSFGVSGEFYAALIPSRFVGSLSYPLCLFAGYFIMVGERRRLRAVLVVAAPVIFFALKVREFPELKSAAVLSTHALYSLIGYPIATALLVVSIILGGGGVKRAGTAAIVIFAVLLLGAGVVRAMKVRVEVGRNMTLQELDDFNRMKASIPPDALVVNQSAMPRDKYLYGWLPYWLWRECTFTPLPSSEGRLSSSVRYKREWLGPGMHEAIVWSHVEARSVVFIVPKFGDLGYPSVKRLYTGPQRSAYLYDPSGR